MVTGLVTVSPALGWSMTWNSGVAGSGFGRQTSRSLVGVATGVSWTTGVPSCWTETVTPGATISTVGFVPSSPPSSQAASSATKVRAAASSIACFMSPPCLWVNSGAAPKVIPPSTAGLDPQPLPVSRDGDVTVQVGAENGVAVQALEHLRRRVPVAVVLPDRDHVNQRTYGGHELAGAGRVGAVVRHLVHGRPQVGA